MHPLIVNLSDGSTARFDLSDGEDERRWRALQRERMSDIRGVQIKSGRTLHTLPLPSSGFKRVFVDAERVCHRQDPTRTIGTRATVFADNVSASVLVYDSGRPPMVRYSLEHTGHPLHLPHLSGD